MEMVYLQPPPFYDIFAKKPAKQRNRVMVNEIGWLAFRWRSGGENWERDCQPLNTKSTQLPLKAGRRASMSVIKVSFGKKVPGATAYSSDNWQLGLEIEADVDPLTKPAEFRQKANALAAELKQTVEGLIGQKMADDQVTEADKEMLKARGKLKRPATSSNWRAQVEEELAAEVFADREALKKQKPEEDVKGDEIPF